MKIQFLFVHPSSNLTSPDSILFLTKDSFPGSFILACPIPGPDLVQTVLSVLWWMWMVLISNRFVSLLPDPEPGYSLILTAAFDKEFFFDKEFLYTKNFHKETYLSKQANLNIYFYFYSLQ